MLFHRTVFVILYYIFSILYVTVKYIDEYADLCYNQGRRYNVRSAV